MNRPIDIPEVQTLELAAGAPAPAEEPGLCAPAVGLSPRWLWLAWLGVAVCFVSVLLLSFGLWRDSQAAQRAQFEQSRDEVTNAILARMHVYEQVLRAAQSLFLASVYVSRNEWRTFARMLEVQRYYPGVQALGYSLWIAPDDLARHVASVRAEGFTDYDVFPATPRDSYTAAVYLEPFDRRNRAAFGYDMWSNPVRRAAMAHARDTGEITITHRVRLVQEIDSDVQAGFLMYLPHYFGLDFALGENPSVADRRAALVGFVHISFRMRDLMRGVIGRLSDLRLAIYDGDAVRPEKLMFDSLGREGTAAGTPRFASVRTVPIRGVNWTLAISSLPAFRHDEAADRQPYLVLGAGMIICLLFAGVVWSWGATGRRAKTMAAEMVASLRRQHAELLLSNVELEHFAYVASHDLRAPLRNMNFLLSWIIEDHGNELSPAVREQHGELAGCVARMDALLNAILEYSRLGSLNERRQWIDSRQIVIDAIKLIGPPDRMTVETVGDLPGFYGSRARMTQVFANLISNAIKHHDRAEGRIEISASEADGTCEFRVRDDGPGIPTRFRARVFEMFKTLKPQDEVEGSGMGLAIVQKTIEQHGGRIWIEDTRDARGVCFAFTVRKDMRDAGAASK